MMVNLKGGMLKLMAMKEQKLHRRDGEVGILNHDERCDLGVCSRRLRLEF
jgi:hypothetical protein